MIVPAMTFAATANCVVYQGGTPVFADVDPDTLLIDPADVEKRITDRTRSIICVDYAGQPCDYDRLKHIANQHGLVVVGDGCHALGAEYKGRKIGSVADLTAFSFHPVKHVTTGEGGMIVTDDQHLASKMRRFRNHGINTDFRQRERMGSWFYELEDLGYNYRITDIQCALGISQMRKLPEFLFKRWQFAAHYDELFEESSGIKPLGIRSDVLPANQSVENHINPSTAPYTYSNHAFHLYVVKIDYDSLGITKKNLFMSLKDLGIGVNVHYIPVHLHPYYKRHFGTCTGQCPIAEEAYHHILSLPIHSGMNLELLDKVCQSLNQVIQA